MFNKILLVVVVFVFLTIGCGGFYRSCGRPIDDIKLYKLEIGMSKEKVIENLGDPYNVIGSKRFDEGVVEVWEYRKYNTFNWNILEQVYWIYLLNDKLEQWGRPGDWQEEADRIYEFRMR